MRLPRDILKCSASRLWPGAIFNPARRCARNAIVINQTMARQLFDGVNPLGKTIITGSTVHEIVGVARDAYLTGLDRFVPLFFQPFNGAQMPHLLVRADFPGAADIVARIAKGIEARARIQSMPLSDNLDRELSGSRAGAAIAGVLGVFALALAAIGMSGVFAFLVEQRTKEIGIRMALGAAPNQVIALVLGGTSRAAIVGLAIGYLATVGSRSSSRSICMESVLSIAAHIWRRVRSWRSRGSPPRTSLPAARHESIRSGRCGWIRTLWGRQSWRRAGFPAGFFNSMKTSRSETSLAATTGGPTTPDVKSQDEPNGLRDSGGLGNVCFDLSSDAKVRRARESMADGTGKWLEGLEI